MPKPSEARKRDPIETSLCAFCDLNEATHFSMDWDAMLCDECEEAQRATLEDHRVVKQWVADIRATASRPRFQPVGPCPCECNSGGFCGGCGHAGCGGRRG